MVLVVEPVRIDKMGPCGPQSCRLLVHQRGKVFNALRHVDRDSRPGVIAGGQHKTVEKLLHSQGISRL